MTWLGGKGQRQGIAIFTELVLLKIAMSTLQASIKQQSGRWPMSLLNSASTREVVVKLPVAESNMSSSYASAAVQYLFPGLLHRAICGPVARPRPVLTRAEAESTGWASG
jgi:hypothetical protein